MKSYRYSTVRYPKGKAMVIGLVIWFVLSSVFVAFGSINVMKSQETESWSSTSGIILSSYVDRHSGGDGSTYGAEITYQYNLNGISYTSDTISFGYSYFSDRNAAEQIVQNNPVGKIVTIYYNPETPSEAVLIKGIDGASLIFFSFGLFFLLLGILVLIYFILKNKDVKSSKQISITLDKTSFLPGETIKGAVNLSLKKQRHAKALKVALVVNRDFQYSTHNKEAYNSYNIYHEEIVLDAESEYQGQVYSFLIKIPLDILEKVEKLSAEGTVGTIKKISEWGINKGLGNYIEKNTWYVFASLELTKRLDISNKVEINVSNVP